MDYAAARGILGRLKTPRADLTPEIVGEALKVFAEHQVVVYQGMASRGTGGAPDWTRYEINLSEVGSALELFLKGHKDVLGRNALTEAIADVAADKRFGKGRQAFVSILGERGGASFGEILKPLIADPDVDGQAVHAVTRIRLKGCDALVKPLTEKPNPTWIRNAAKKYLERYGEQPGVL